MPAYVYAKVNKETLRFIRDNKQVTFDYIERITKFPEEKISMWEDVTSDKLPTINQAKKLALCYRVPFAGFYMNSSDINVKHLPRLINKRTMLDATTDDSAINLALFDMINERDFYVETKETFRETIPTFNLQISHDLSTSEWARIIREYFDIKLSEQYKCSSKRKFYLYLREKIEAKGIFIQGFQKVDVGTLRGVAIVDDSMPIIGINDDDRYPAKSFSILHELVHIIKRTSSICNDMFGFNPRDDEEVFCNAVAGEVLVPRVALHENIKGYFRFQLDSVDALADKFSVSSEVVARRLLDTGRCDRSWYNSISTELCQRNIFEKEKQKADRQKKGRVIPRNMPREAIDRTSAAMCSVLLRGYSERIFDKADISAHIGIGLKHINKFVSEVMGWYL
jgi:Zn-dependent peptidase ImmA (M78 family)